MALIEYCTIGYFSKYEQSVLTDVCCPGLHHG